MEFLLFFHAEETRSIKKRDLLTRCKGKHFHNNKSSGGAGCPESSTFSDLEDFKDQTE